MSYKLDTYQHAAATAPEPWVAVSACPGAGKSSTLVARFLWLLDQGIPASEICCITFTRYAANELKNRIGSRAGLSSVGTYHNFALNIVKRYGELRGWQADWLTILDEDEAELDEREVLKDMGLMTKKGKWGKVKAYEWRAFKESKLTGMEHKIVNPVIVEKLELAWKSFVKRLKAENCLTFGLIILEAIELMKLEEVSGVMRKEFRHCLVDEVQDTNLSCYRLIWLLEPTTLFLVGDMDQSIYEWNGAVPRLFYELCITPETALYELPNSYRFGINIATPANALISHNTERLDTAIQAIASNKGSLNVVMGAQYEDIAQTILGEIEGGRKPEDIAVLARKHRTLDHLEQVLRPMRNQIPYKRIGGEAAIPNTGEFRTIKGYLRLAVNEADRRAFMAISAAEHIFTDNLYMLRQKSLADRTTLKIAYDKPLPETVDEVQGYLQHQDPNTDYKPAFNYLKTVMFYEGVSETQDLVHLLAMQSMQDQMRGEKKEVLLQTVHSSKGLGFPVVMLIGMNSKDFPSKRSVNDGKISEERRLAYVGMTRAEETLYMISGTGEKGAYEQSRFIKEAGI